MVETAYRLLTRKEKLGVLKLSKTNWDNRYLKVAKEIATWSKDPRTGVGAVVVRDNQIVSTGFNGFPREVLDDDRLKQKELKQLMVVHAEVNALISAGDRARGATIYIVGKPVCSRCASSIIQAGITRVVAERPKTKDHSNDSTATEDQETGKTDWDAMGRIACDMFLEAGVKFHAIDATNRIVDSMKEENPKLAERANDEDPAKERANE